MKKLLFFLLFFLMTNFAFAEDNQTDNKTKKEHIKKECQQVCVKWEEKKECKPAYPEGEICTLWRECIEYIERCKEITD